MIENSKMSANSPQNNESDDPQLSTQTPDVQINRFCANCGSPLKPNMKFCAKCGKAVYAEAQTSPVTFYPSQSTAQTITTQPRPPQQQPLAATMNFESQIPNSPPPLPPLQEPPAASALYSSPPPPPIVNAAADEPNVMRAVWVFAAGMLLILLVMFLPVQFLLRVNAFRLRDPLMAIVLGFGFCIAYMERVSYKIIGSAGILLFTLFYSLTQIIMINPTLDFNSIITFPTFWRILRQELICGFILASIAVCAGIWLRKTLKFWLTALIGAALVIVVNLVFSRTVFMMQDATTMILRVVFNCIVIPGFLFLAALLAHMTTGFKSRTVRISIGARVWCIIVSVSMGISIIINAFIGDRMIVFQSMLLIPTFVGMILLSANRRIGFSLALIGVGLSLMNVYSLIWVMPLDIFITYIGFAFGGIANVIITWLIIARAWRGASVPAAYGAQMYYASPGYIPQYGVPQYGAPQYGMPQYSAPQQYGAQQYGVRPYGVQGYTPQYGMPVYGEREKAKLPAVFPVFAIIGSLLGLALFIAGLVSIITDGFYIPPFAFGILLGAAIAAVEISATILYMKRRGRTGKALQIISLCITAFMIISSLIAFTYYIIENI